MSACPPVRGRAALVGAGPGDPDLLTLRAVKAIQSADVVVFDALIDPSILDMAPASARRIDVGKRCGRHAMQQSAINKLIVREALSGRGWLGRRWPTLLHRRMLLPPRGFWGWKPAKPPVRCCC